MQVATNCRGCRHTVALDAEAFRLVRTNGRTTAAFTCPSCGDFQVRLADVPTLARFNKAGVSPVVVELTPCLVEGQRPTGPPLDEDDLLNFGLELERTLVPADSPTAVPCSCGRGCQQCNGLGWLR